MHTAVRASMSSMRTASRGVDCLLVYSAVPSSVACGRRARARARHASTSTSGSSAPSDGPYDPYNCITARLSEHHAATSFGSTGKLAGWDVAVKANICTREGSTTCSSRMLSDYHSSFDADCVHRLRQAGARIASRTNCDEFGMGSENVHSFHGPVRNPAKAALSASGQETRIESGREWDLEKERVAGGSSGGSAAAVKAGLARIALGSDTGGSIRLPAAYCGVVGLKPSYGLVSRWGLVSYADSLDTVGLLGRSIADVETAFSIISAPDERDPTCVDADTRRRASDIVAGSSMYRTDSNSLEGLRIGIPREYFPAELHPRILGPFRQTLARLREQGAELVSVSLPSTRFALSAYYIISSSEASSNLARYDGVEFGHRAEGGGGGGGKAQQQRHHHPYARTRSEALGDEVQRRILLGTYALSADKFDNYFLQAARIRREVKRDFARCFRIPSPLARSDGSGGDQSRGGVDVLLHPSAVNTAPTLADALAAGSSGGRVQGNVSSYVQDVLTVPASLAGLPALNLPVGVAEDDGWPVGVTATSQWGCERILLDIGKALEL